MSEWLPIETAPRDGTEIIGWGRYNSAAAIFVWSERQKLWVASHDQAWVIENESDFGTDYKTEGKDMLTHWQPLPAPPTLGD